MGVQGRCRENIHSTYISQRFTFRTYKPSPHIFKRINPIKIRKISDTRQKIDPKVHDQQQKKKGST